MEEEEKVDGSTRVFVFLFVAAFWLGVAYVVLHFITKKPEWGEIWMELLIMLLTSIAFYFIGYRSGQRTEKHSK